MHFITPQLARDAWQNPLSFRLGGKTPYFAFWFSTWRKTSHIYLFIYLFHREKLVLEQSETSSCVKSCCSCLFTRVLELQPAVLGMLSVAEIEVKRLGVSAQVAERIACAGCAQVWLCSGAPGAGEIVPRIPHTASPPHQFAAAFPAANNQLDHVCPRKCQQQQMSTGWRETCWVNTWHFHGPERQQGFLSCCHAPKILLWQG